MTSTVPHREEAPPYLARLNPAQREAVLATEGPVLVLAGAGTGKTRVLTTRLAHLLATRRASPGRILAVTFTNKAAREMRERIGALIGDAVEGMRWLGTFHSLSAQILRRHAELVGLRPDFTIIDTDDQLRLIKQLFEAEKVNEKRWPARQYAGLLDTWKNRALCPDDLTPDEEFRFADNKAVTLYRQYQERLKVLNAADFGDLILETVRLLRGNPDVLAEYHRRFSYILVDEYQDTNVAQYLWLRLLAQGHRNICCVGDDDQSIYGWRGAEVDNILRFETDFPGAQIVRLEQNYRSTSHILGAASGLIASNAARLGKTLWTDQGHGERVRVRGVWDSESEARFIGEDIEALQRKGTRLSEVAILVRASFQMRELEDRLFKLGVPYKVIGGPRFYEREEIRDAHAYFRLVANPDHDLAFERIVNTPRRGIAAATMSTLHAIARSSGVSLLRAARIAAQSDELKPAPRRALAGFIAMIDRFAREIDTLSHTELAAVILDETGYTQMWQEDRSPNAPSKLENLKELVSSMAAFASMAEYLDHVALVMDLEAGEDGDRVSLMTLHAAKGLEFDHVFLPGWEEGLFPHQRALDEGLRGLEEERRLAYVGLTRARVTATVMFASMRMTYGRWQNAIPSRFIDELPRAHVEVEGEERTYGGVGRESRFDAMTDFSSDYVNPGWQRAKSRAAGPAPGSRPMRPAQIIEAGPLLATSDPKAETFGAGERVFHQKFGYGLVLEADGTKLHVDFEKAGRKHVIASFLSKA